MKELLTYAAGVVVCSGIFVIFCRVALQRRAPFRVVRMFLVASLVAAAVIPALEIPVWRSATVVLQLSHSAPAAAASPLESVGEAPKNWGATIVWLIYGAGVLAMAGAMVRELVRIARIGRRGERCEIANECEGRSYKVVVSEGVGAPFSFLSTVYVGRDTRPDDLRQIVMHERSHIRHRHSAEKIAMGVLKTLLWFSPAVWWAAHLMSEVHEFEADRDVLDGGLTVEEYLPLIFRQAFGSVPELSVGLGDSLTKKRFLMIRNRMKPTKMSRLRVAGVLPLVAGMMMIFSFTNRPAEIVVASGAESVTFATPAAEAPESVTIYAHGDTKMGAVIDTRRELREAGVTKVTYASDARAVPASQKPEVPLFAVDKMPEFQGGDLNDYRNWVQSRMVYPREASDKGVQGTVTVKFVVEKDGSVSSVEDVQSPDPILFAEVSRVMAQSPKWAPGVDNGASARVMFILPVQFRLQGDGSAAPVEVAYPRTAVRPIYIVDGVQVEPSEADAMDARDIESIRILKDDAAIAVTSAIYGSRGANGVVVITTKKS
ncbi:MAG: TonB family protein [Alistipes sp.]|jgi:TonB family protein|nr:TonB family protein [Alistipes sp.]